MRYYAVLQIQTHPNDAIQQPFWVSYDENGMIKPRVTLVFQNVGTDAAFEKLGLEQSIFMQLAYGKQDG